MKISLILLAFVTLSGCYAGKEIQADIVKTELVRIDTIQRYSSLRQQQLIWRDEDKVEYISYVPMDQIYIVGTKMIMLRPR